eukprot:CAMPEP_0197652666 /NCGR_PEP_ID=MMETSP1338-20131121/34589_1 /TAXON_ID=43686 ORGANISM="Pelagodinium beii, Strain RCC1491" /NCGR_SAMPLE_ID=MMETSP1338 /ASSEMBLY_ACC=CAM_ASM_000754 /LENGTH=456 /DNA_ID=CAMNT_0043227593 /DNA_START=114 /DNA_END=1484 /DNA_ORIENTATION=-
MTAPMLIQKSKAQRSSHVDFPNASLARSNVDSSDIRLQGWLTDEVKPDLSIVGMVALGFLLCLALLDIFGHFLGQHVVSAERIPVLDYSIDSLAALAGLIVSFIAYGITQEYVMTTEYDTGAFPSAAYLVLANRAFQVGLCGTILLVGQKPLELAPSVRASVPGCLGLLASYVEETALLYLAYPIITVFKSSKLVPTMAVNTLVNGEKQGLKDYLIALVVCFGVTGFVLSSSSSDDSSAAQSGVLIGVMLMITGLIGDAFEVSFEKHVFNEYPTFGHIQMMFVTGLYGTVLSFILLLCSTGFDPLFEFLDANPSCKFHMLMLASFSSLGVYFIFYIVDHQGPVALQLAMAFKQVCSIIFSSLLYNHPLSAASACFAGGTIAAVLIRPLLKFYDVEQQPLKVGALRSMLNVTRSIHESMGYEVRTTTTVLRAVNRFRRHGKHEETSEETKTSSEETK